MSKENMFSTTAVSSSILPERDHNMLLPIETVTDRVAVSQHPLNCSFKAS